MRKRQQATTEVKRRVNEIRGYGIFDVNRGKISLLFSYDLGEKLDGYRKNLVEKLVEHIGDIISEELLVELSDEHFYRIENSINKEDFSKVLEEIIKELLDFDEETEKFKEDIRKNRSKLSELERKQRILEEFIEFYRVIEPKVREYRDKRDKFTEKL